ncbi:uncharacterized protein LOC127177573 isoform X2 [Labeo rohita]|uniref:uncharacterized protein LOC127177573 isoform X2 n=1 Tax=Labeo rohita TaxID=84645 RepID=UPI0021E2BAD4|nr:uncharacterized protein LOC127177573 isoform X2 [Labeo rohita]
MFVHSSLHHLAYADVHTMASQNASGSMQMQLIQVDPIRRNVSLALTQIVVWPFIYLIFLMLLIFSKKETFRTETRYILFGHSLLQSEYVHH